MSQKVVILPTVQGKKGKGFDMPKPSEMPQSPFRMLVMTTTSSFSSSFRGRRSSLYGTCSIFMPSLLMWKLVDWCLKFQLPPSWQDWSTFEMAMEVFSSIRYYLKPEEISIDNWVFKLHYRISTAILLGSSAIGVAKQYFGDPINCQVSYDGRWLNWVEC